jgi:hypothetical protein
MQPRQQKVKTRSFSWSLIHTSLCITLVERIRLALMPGGGSNTKQRPSLSRFEGFFGFISIDKNIRKLGLGFGKLWSFFSN